MLFSCGKEDNDETEDNRPEYTATFVMGPSKIKQTYREGDTIVPPTFEPYETADYYVVFKSWEGVEFAPVTEDVTYKALFDYEYKNYTATFIMGDKVETAKVAYNTSAICPEDIPDCKGMKITFINSFTVSVLCVWFLWNDQ